MRTFPRSMAVLAAAAILVPVAATSASAAPRSMPDQATSAVSGQATNSGPGVGAHRLSGVSADRKADRSTPRHQGRPPGCGKHRHGKGPATPHRCGEHGPRPGSGSGSGLGSSTGIHLYNNTLNKLVLTDVYGSNEGVPVVGSVLSPGVGFQDFEVTFRAAKSTTVTASYDVYDLTDTKIGSGAVTLSNNEWGSTSVSGAFYSLNGLVRLPLTTAKYGSDFQVQSTNPGPITIDASTPTAVAMINEFCNTKNTNAKCTFTPSSRTPGTQMHLLAESYTIPGGSTSGAVSVESGYTASSSTTWSVTVTAQMGVADVFSAGISSTYGQTVSWSNTFTAGESIPVDPGYTGYIWGESPVINYTGTMQIKLGATTYNLVNAGVAVPDASRHLSAFQAGTYPGKDPLNSPDSPPATAMPLT